jgi:hypothetical protein
MEIEFKTGKKDYFFCSMYYMRRYFGLREIILLSVLLTVGSLLYVWFKNIFILVLFGITVLLLVLTLSLFVYTALSGYKIDVKRKNVETILLNLGESAVKAESLNPLGQPVRSEEFGYEKLEKVVIRKKKVYIYATVAVFFYLSTAEMGADKTAELSSLLHSKLPEEKFKFKKTMRMFPKKKKTDTTKDA